MQVRAFVRGDPVERPTESMRLFALCSAMEWAHLPVAGGLYDQHPQLLDEWLIIFQAKAEEEAKEQERRKREAKNRGR